MHYADLVKVLKSGSKAEGVMITIIEGWTIEQFAERVDLSANYVGDLERGVKIPKLETFIRIVEVLDVSADVLIRDSVPSASHVADDELSRKLSQLTPGQKKAAIDILNAYTDNIPYITK